MKPEEEMANALSHHEIDITPDETTQSPTKPKWANLPKVADIQSAILQAAEQHDEQVSKVKEWRNLRKGIVPDATISSGTVVTSTRPYGTAVGKRGKINKSKIQPKLIRKLNEWRISALSEPLLAPSNLIKASPVTWEDTEAARQNELLLNDQFNNKINKVKFIGDYVRQCVEDGTTIIMANWITETKTVSRATPIYEVKKVQDSNKRLLLVLQKLVDMEKHQPDQFYSTVPEVWREAVQVTIDEGAAYAPHIIGHSKIKQETKTKNQPDFTFIDSEDFWLDPTAKGDVLKARYAAFRFRSSIPEMKASGKYFNLDAVEELESDSTDTATGWDEYTEPTNLMADQLGKRVTVYEYWGLWDVHNKGELVPVVCSFVGNTMIRMDENPYPDAFIPFVVVPYIPVLNSCFGDADAELIGDNQKLIGASVRGMVDLMAKTVSGQTGMRQDALDPLNQQRFLNGKPYFFNPAMGDPATNVYTHKFPEFPQSAAQMIQLQTQDAEEMAGVRPFSGADNAENGNTKSQNQAKSPLDAAAKRELDVLRRLVVGLEQLSRMVMSMNTLFLSDEEVIRITNEEFVAIKREHLHGEVDIRIEVTTPEENHARASELSFMLQTLGQTTDDKTRNEIMASIADLRKMPELAHYLRNTEREPTEEEKQRMKQAEEEHQMNVQLLQAKIAVEQARAQQLGSTVPLNQAKVGTEQAKAQLLGSQSDVHDQDFVNRAQSTNDNEHATALQQAQSEGNIHLEKVKHQLHEQSKNNDLQRDYAKQTIANALKTK